MKPTTKRPTRKEFALVTGAKMRTRTQRYTEPPRRFWLDVGKRISLEMTAQKHNFAVKGGDR